MEGYPDTAHHENRRKVDQNLGRVQDSHFIQNRSRNQKPNHRALGRKLGRKIERQERTGPLATQHVQDARPALSQWGRTP